LALVFDLPFVLAVLTLALGAAEDLETVDDFAELEAFGELEALTELLAFDFALALV